MNSKEYLEHANVTCKDLTEAVRFFRSAFPHWRIRGGGKSSDRDWLHFGTTETYIALECAFDLTASTRTPYHQPGINHVAFVIEETLDALVERMRAAKFEPTSKHVIRAHPARERIYFKFSDGGVEIEFIRYLSEDNAQRHDYAHGASDYETLDVDTIWKNSDPNQS
jgi:Glyoxalase/Bleomycin resistance protein/Dioxygenase superfamily